MHVLCSRYNSGEISCKWFDSKSVHAQDWVVRNGTGFLRRICFLLLGNVGLILEQINQQPYWTIFLFGLWNLKTWTFTCYNIYEWNTQKCGSACFLTSEPSVWNLEQLNLYEIACLNHFLCGCIKAPLYCIYYAFKPRRTESKTLIWPWYSCI